MFVFVELAFIVNQIAMAIDTLFFIPRPWPDYGSVGQHRATFIGDIQQVAVALHALIIFRIGISFCAIFWAVIFIHRKVDDQIFNTVVGFGIEKI